MSVSAHAGKTLRCPGHDDADQYCDTELTYVDHGRFVSSPQDREARERFEASALRFQCPECDHVMWLCPICSDDDDRSPAGWIDASDGSSPIPCHNCNQEETRRRIRHHGHIGEFGERRRGR